MERLTKRHGKHAVQIGAETRRNDPGWDRLADLEDMAEQGRLIELPVPEGAEVWKIAYQRRHDKADYFGIKPCKFELILLERFRDTVFKTKAEAEARLAELEVSDE